MTMLEPSITSRDPKGRRATGIFEDAYNKANLDDASAQRLNERGDKMRSGIQKLISDLAYSRQYANEEVSSRFTYPSQHQGPKIIAGQVAIIAEIFDLDVASALAYTTRLPEIPEEAEGWFAIPSVSALARVHFPEVDDRGEQYCRALQLVLEKIADSRKFKSYHENSLEPSNVRVHTRTAEALASLEETQQSDILVIPAQLGMRHRGRSVRRARECFAGNEFGLTSLAVGSILLTHPERLVRFDELEMDCAGDEFNSPYSDVRFGFAPVFYFDEDRVEFGTFWFDRAHGHYGSVSGFVPQ